MAQPAERPGWAEERIEEVATINGVPQLVSNRDTPPDAYQRTGILARQRVGRSRMNWILWILSQWVKHFADMDNVGTVYATVTNENAAEVSERRGGTWVSIGNTTVSGQTIYYFRKTTL